MKFLRVFLRAIGPLRFPAMGCGHAAVDTTCFLWLFWVGQEKSRCSDKISINHRSKMLIGQFRHTRRRGLIGV